MLPHLISRRVLEKENRLAVLQGIAHTAPRGFYEKVQHDINAAVENGYLLLVEGLRNDPAVPLNSLKAKRLRWYFRNFVFKKLPTMSAKRDGTVTEKQEITLPAGTISTDMSLEEFVNVCAAQEVPYPWALHIVVLATSAVISSSGTVGDRFPIWLRMIITFVGVKRFNAWHKRSVDAMEKKLNPIMLDYRNQKIFDQAEVFGREKNLFLAYGNRHIPGLVRLFQQGGWVLKESTDIDLNTFN